MDIQNTPIMEMAQKLGAKTVGEFLDLFGKFMDSQESNPVEEPTPGASNPKQLSASFGGDISKLEQASKVIGAKNTRELVAMLSPNSKATFPQLAECARILGFTSLDDLYNYANSLKAWIAMDAK